MKNSFSKQVQRKWADVKEKSCSPKSTAKNELNISSSAPTAKFQEIPDLCKTRITIPNFDGICLTWIYEIHRNILQFSEMKV